MPTTLPTYELEPYRTTLETTVLSTGVDGERPFAVLADTLFYPEGGGQPADFGFVGDVAVVDVQKGEGGIRHFLASAVAPGPVTLKLDWARRFDHMQQHTAQHLISALAMDRLGWKTTAFHLYPVLCDIEVAAQEITAGQLSALEEAVVAEIRAARPVTHRRVTVEEYGAMSGVRSRGLPAGHVGDVRLVEIEGVDLNTCGGTHVASTAEIECVKLLSTENLRGGTRIYWVAGGRVRARLAEHEARNARLRSTFDAGDDDLPEVAALKLSQLKEAQQRERQLAERLADATADSLAAAPEAAVESHFEGLDGKFLERVGRRFGEKAGGKLAFLTATNPKGAAFTLAAGEGFGGDTQALGREVAAALGGRGGGRGALFQGQAPNLDGRAAAWNVVRQAVGDR